MAHNPENPSVHEHPFNPENPLPYRVLLTNAIPDYTPKLQHRLLLAFNAQFKYHPHLYGANSSWEIFNKILFPNNPIHAAFIPYRFPTNDDRWQLNRELFDGWHEPLIDSLPNPEPSKTGMPYEIWRRDGLNYAFFLRILGYREKIYIISPESKIPEIHEINGKLDELLQYYYSHTVPGIEDLTSTMLSDLEYQPIIDGIAIIPNSSQNTLSYYSNQIHPEKVWDKHQITDPALVFNRLLGI
jgi:hypothetical protein